MILYKCIWSENFVKKDLKLQQPDIRRKNIQNSSNRKANIFPRTCPFIGNVLLSASQIAGGEFFHIGGEFFHILFTFSLYITPITAKGPQWVGGWYTLRGSYHIAKHVPGLICDTVGRMHAFWINSNRTSDAISDIPISHQSDFLTYSSQWS